MGYKAKVLVDSIADGVRVTTLEITFPRFILAEFNTARVFSRNSASSRAIPVNKRIRSVLSDPFIPETFGANKKGMQSEENIQGWKAHFARYTWLLAVYFGCFFAWVFSKLKIHKQWANRIIEFACWHTVIVTSTEWENFFNLRVHPDAQPEIQKIARMMKEAMNESKPIRRLEGDQHLPLIWEEDISAAYELFRRKFGGNPDESWIDEILFKISAGRCARVSYLTHDGRRDIEADIALCDRLLSAGHLSPMEHCAMVDTELKGFCGNFRAPWKQYRKMIPGEDVFRKEIKK